MAQQDRTTLKAAGTTIKNETTDGANTASRLGTLLENLADSAYVKDDETLETSTQLDTRDTANRSRANHTGQQASSTISDFNSAVDARIAASYANTFSLSAGANELTFDEPYKVAEATGGTYSFTLAASGNVDNYQIELRLDQSTISSFSADFENDGSLTSDNTKYQRVFLKYDDFAGNATYIIKHSSPINDITAPVFTAGPTSQNVAQTTAEVTFTINETGDVFAVVVADGATAPTPAEVIAGTGSGGSGQVDTDSVLANTSGTLSFSGLTASTAYDIYVVARDDEGTPNVQSSPTKVDVTTASAFTDTVARAEGVGERSVSDQTFAWNSATRTIGVWLRGVNYTKNTDTWNIFSQNGSGTEASRFISLSSDTDLYRFELWDSVNNNKKIVTFPEGTELNGAGWHLYLIEFDYDNFPNGTTAVTSSHLRVSIDNGTALSPTTLGAPSSWLKTNASSTKEFFFTGGPTEDNFDDFFIINRLLTAGERTSIYNSGSPVELRSSLGGPIADADIECYVTFEGNAYTDLMGNYTFTAVAGGGAYTSDTPTNPA